LTLQDIASPLMLPLFPKEFNKEFSRFELCLHKALKENT